MVTTIIHRDDYNKVYDLRGLSSDNKPTNVPNGSTFVEMNTSKGYIFDEANSTWHELSGGVSINVATGVLF